MKIYFLLITLFFVAGCSTFNPKQQQLTVQTEPVTAEILINGKHEGTGQVNVMVPRDQNVGITASNEGCQSVHKSVGHHMNGSGYWDAVGGAFLLVPWVGLADAGSRDLDQTNVQITLPCGTD